MKHNSVELLTKEEIDHLLNESSFEMLGKECKWFYMGDACYQTTCGKEFYYHEFMWEQNDPAMIKYCPFCGCEVNREGEL